MRLDLAVVADPRRRGADGRALALTLEIAIGLGYRAGLLPLGGPSMRPAAGAHPRIRRLLDRGLLTLVDPGAAVEASLALGWEGSAFASLAHRPPRLRPDRALVRIDQPGQGSLSAIEAAAAAVLGSDVLAVPADPLIARHHPDAGLDPWIAPVAPAPSGRHERRGHGLGRHVAGGPEALDPAAPFGSVAAGSLLRLTEHAAQRFLQDPDAALGILAQPDDLADPAAWLADLDAWVMVTGSGWLPWLPPGLIEALASAPRLILPPALAPLLGAAVDYAEPAQVAGVLARDPPAITAARDLAHSLASPDRLATRLEAEIGPPGRTTATIAPRRGQRRRRRALFLSPNGVGMGHLTRLLAIARRLPADLEPVFLSMSQGLGVVREMGFQAEYTPYQTASLEGPEKWAQHFRARLAETIAFYDPAVVVFDGNVPYQPLVDVRLKHADRPFIWLRRGLWRPESGRRTIDRARHFDLVIEPGELAAELDRGITASRDGEALLVAPIVLLDPAELPDRAAARAELGLDPARTCALVQLGGRNNYDYAQVDAVLVDRLGARPEVQTVVVDWLIGEHRAVLPPSFRRIEAYPTARWLNAFDLAVSAAGYNSFHELTGAALPTVFVPNENPMMDEQEARCLWAERRGCGLIARARDPHRLAWALDRLQDPSCRAAMRAAAVGLPGCDGGQEVARLVDETARALPIDRRPGQMSAAMTRG